MRCKTNLKDTGYICHVYPGLYQSMEKHLVDKNKTPQTSRVNSPPSPSTSPRIDHLSPVRLLLDEKMSLSESSVLYI